MLPSEFIDSALQRGHKLGIEPLSPLERDIRLIEVAGTVCDMGGIDLFLDRYPTWLAETIHAFAKIGASEIAQSLSAIQAVLPARPDALLDRATRLLCNRTGYNGDAVLRFVAANM